MKTQSALNLLQVSALDGHPPRGSIEQKGRGSIRTVTQRIFPSGISQRTLFPDARQTHRETADNHCGCDQKHYEHHHHRLIRPTHSKPIYSQVKTLQSEKPPTKNIRLFTDAARACTDELNQVEYLRKLRQICLDACEGIRNGESFAEKKLEGQPQGGL